MNSKQVYIRVSQQVYAEIQQVAATNRRSISAEVAVLVEQKWPGVATQPIVATTQPITATENSKEVQPVTYINRREEVITDPGEIEHYRKKDAQIAASEAKSHNLSPAQKAIAEMKNQAAAKQLLLKK